MHADSRQGPMPLAEAMIAWSDPALVEAIRVAEAELPDGDLQRHERTPLDFLATQRRPPLRCRPPALSASMQRLDQAWDVLFATFRLALERDEVALAGFPAWDFSGAGLELLPRIRAAEFIFDPAAGAVFVGPRLYLGVRAMRSGATTVLAQSAVAGVASCTEARTLREALLGWTDPRLLDDYKRMEWLFRKLLPNDMQETPFIRNLDDPEPAVESFAQYQVELPKLAIFFAWNNLEADLKRQMEIGSLLPEGVEIMPTRRMGREPIPHLWAADFKFEFWTSRIAVVHDNIVSHSYVAVRVVRVARREDEARITTAKAPLALNGGGQSGKPKPNWSGGRKSDRPMILAALRKHWFDLYPNGVPEEREEDTGLARRLRRRMLSARTGASQRVPAENTVRKHLPFIYGAVLAEKGRAPPIEQEIRSARP